ncbi:MAG TPA: hypothetical protein VHV51_19950 [Polyangiaceae bacterium]|nr:hypothetical protein [Polyangiaceae bacterium]
MRWLRAITDWTWMLLASALGLGILAGALHDVSRAWDTWYYHLPFAAELGGLPNGGSFELSAINQARFAGFPLLGECIQALLWRAFGSPVAANLLAFSSLPLFALFLRKRFGVPLHLTVLGLLAVPLIQIHATSCYVDLPANAALAALVLSVIAAYAEPEAPSLRSLLAALGCAAIASNMKFLLEPIVLVAIALLAVRVAQPLLRTHETSERKRALRGLGSIALSLIVVFATPLKNLILHHNPAYPERMSVFGWTLPGMEQPYSSTPIWLAHAPEPVRFFASVFELGLQPLASHARWSIDQWSPPSRADYRMGGFFGAYVAFELCVLGVRVARERVRAVRAAALGFALLTCVTCVMPQAHELRYYLGWMIVLVSLNRWLAVREGALAPYPRALGAASTLALCAVLYSTRLTYVYPSGVTLAELLTHEIDPKVLSSIAEGERVCVRRMPFALLWAAPFHPPRSYRVKQAESAADCRGYRAID